MKHVVVYFNNNNKLEYPADMGKILFKVGNSADPDEPRELDDGTIVVNWNNVSFYKVVDRDDDQEDSERGKTKK